MGHSVEYAFETINFPNDTFTQLLGINKKGKIAGYHGATINKGFTFKTKSGKFKDENFPGSAQTQVITINDKGQTGGLLLTRSVILMALSQRKGYSLL